MTYIFGPFNVISNYKVIFGQDLLQKLGINLDLNNFVDWKETKIPMISINCKIRTNFTIQDRKILKVQQIELTNMRYQIQKDKFERNEK